MRNVYVVSCGLACFLASRQALSVCPGESMSNGWCWPTGTSYIGNYLQFGQHNPDPAFASSGPHLAMDIKASEDDKVYSVAANGKVMKARSDVKYYGGGESCTQKTAVSIPGGGIVIRYPTSKGEHVDVLYAHIKNLNFKDGDDVGQGVHIGDIGNYTMCGRTMNHLHLGVAFPARDDGAYLNGGKAEIWAGYGNTNKGFVDPRKFFEENSPHSTTVLSEKTVKVAPGTEGFVAWEGLYKCVNAPHAWKTISLNTILFGSARDIQKTCGTIKETYNSNTSPAQSPSMTEKSKQNFFQWVGEYLKEKFSWLSDQLALGATARAAGIGYDDYERSIASSYEAIIYADGTMQLKHPELLSSVYGIDIQKLETDPRFSSHPATLTNGTKKKGTSYPNMVVNDYWIRKGASSTSAHDTTFTFAELKDPNTEWRVQVKNAGKGTKANGKTVTVQAYLWRVKESGDETMVEGIGKEEVNKEMKSGATTTEHHGVGDIIAQAKYPGKYFMTVCLITANSLIEEDKADNCKGNYYFTLINQSDLVAISASSNDNKSVYLQGETASFHASFRLDGDNFPKNANARVAWRLVGPAFPEGKIMETDRIKSTTLANKRGETHGENTTFPIDFASGEYDLYAIANPECTLKETNCGNNQVSYHFRVDAPVVDDGGDEVPPPDGPSDPNPNPGGTDPGATPPPDTAYRFPWKYFVQ